ncbi:uncharacterized protein LOC136079364 [Hydra vulgaris]|uniref:Uncharacterized protein LOC136079364 n=1 Tax=Hydra vulgaris TaxID=6087 RepID=A0ABM4BPX3_HYDVU
MDDQLDGVALGFPLAPILANTYIGFSRKKNGLVNALLPYRFSINAMWKIISLKYSNKNTDANKLRQDVLRVLKIHKPVSTNLDKDQFKALKELKSGNTIRKSKIINYDPTQKLLRQVQNTLRNLKTKFTKNEYRSIYPSDATPPRLYGVIKAHKPTNNYPMRIIVSTIGSPTYKLSNYLVNLIQPTSNLNKTKLRNSKQFVERAQSWYIDPGEFQVSFDIVNLYPSIPVKESIDILLEQLHLCLSNCYFLHERNIHTLEDAGPIGLSLMVVMAESFLQHYEEKALLQAQYLTPSVCVKSFKRYVDDIHSRFINEAESELFLDLLNNQHTNIKYTIEKESDSHTINFLDLSITNNKSGTYLFNIYRKDAITNVQIKLHSCHDPKIIYGVFKGFIQRAFALCSKEHINHELKFLTEMFTENGYNK